MSKDRKALIVFYAVTFAVSLVFDILYIVTKTDVFVVPLMWTPAVVGIVCGKKFYGKERNLGLKERFKPVYIILGLLIPVIYLVPSYLIGWKILGDPTTGLDAIAKSFTGVDGINGTAFVLIAFIPFVIISALTAMGEELGWRGFAYPVLEREFGPVKAVLINGLLWALWHVPLIIGGTYQSSVNLAYGLISFVVCAMIMTLICCWTRSVTGSVIPAVLLHSVHNTVDQVYLQALSTDPKVPYYSGEQGFITIIFIGIIALIVAIAWKKQYSKKAFSVSKSCRIK